MQTTAGKSKFISTATPYAKAGPMPAQQQTKLKPADAAPPPRGELRQRFNNYLTLRQLSGRTIETYTWWIYLLTKFHRRSPDLLGNADLSAWFLHLIKERWTITFLWLGIFCPSGSVHKRCT